jgi:hypothetical protein
VSPKSQQQLCIDSKSRFNHDVASLLILKSKKMGFNLSSILTYSLIGSVEYTGPKEKFDMKAAMYCSPATISKIPVENPLERDCVFMVRLVA